nr:MAG TPA: Mitochondrial genome maintenance exonuclease 1, DNA complex, DNA exonuclease [Caudoviricetes sp.]
MEVKFRESDHTYWLSDRQLISVTQLMKKHGLSADYSAVKADILNAKAERGSLIHKEIEEFINFAEDGFTDELDSFKNLIKEHKIIPTSSETIVHDDLVAGTIDVIGQCPSGRIIVDIKTTSTLHKDALAWQLSIYEYLFQKVHPGASVSALYGIHLNGTSAKLVEVERKPREEIERLFECEKNGELFIPKSTALSISKSELAYMADVERRISELKKQIDIYTKSYNEMKEDLKERMKEQGVKSYEDDLLIITYKDSYTREILDAEKLKADKPEIYSAYKKVTNVKDRVNITLKAL